MFRKAFLASVVVCSLASVASAVPTIIAGNHVFTQNTGLQSFYITVVGEPGDEYEGVDLHLEIIGPGPLLVHGFDIVNDPSLLFNASNTGQGDYGQPAAELPSAVPGVFTTTVPGNAVGPSGNLALITINTDVPVGDYELLLTNEEFWLSDLPPFYFWAEDPALLEHGMITIAPIPEPSTIVLGLFAAAGLGTFVVRRRRARKA